MLIHEAHTGRNRPAGIAVDHATHDLSRRCCLREAGLGERRRGNNAKKTAPAAIQEQIGSVV
jgi:hypothetical protein